MKLAIIYEHKYTQNLPLEFSSAVFAYESNNVLAKDGNNQSIVAKNDSVFLDNKPIAIPVCNEGTFFTDQDEELEMVQHALDRLDKAREKNIIAFPVDGIGRNPKLREKSPKIFSLLDRELKSRFGYVNGKPVKYRVYLQDKNRNIKAVVAFNDYYSLLNQCACFFRGRDFLLEQIERNSINQNLECVRVEIRDRRPYFVYSNAKNKEMIKLIA